MPPMIVVHAKRGLLSFELRTPLTDANRWMLPGETPYVIRQPISTLLDLRMHSVHAEALRE